MKCIICGTEMKKYKWGELYFCPNDTHISFDCNLSDEELYQLYGQDYWNGKEYTDYLADERITRKKIKKSIKSLEKYFPKEKRFSIFEIGCAYGLFLDECRKKLNCEVAGIDVSDAALQYAQKQLCLNVTKGDYVTYQLENEGAVDVIAMWDTIEHLSNPEEFVKKIHSDLGENGILIVSTGDMGSFNAKARGKKWRQYHPPTHLHYFSRKSLIALLERNGFEVLEVTYPWNYVSLNNAAYIILCLRNSQKNLYNFLKKTGVLKLDIAFNLHDYMRIIARKKS